MRSVRRFPRRFVRCISVVVCLALVASSFLLAPIVTFTSKAQRVSSQPQNESQRGKARKVKPNPPEKGAPAFALPNLNEVKGRRQTNPQMRPPIPSSGRSKRKAIELQKQLSGPEPTSPRTGAARVRNPSGGEPLTSKSLKVRQGEARSLHHAAAIGKSVMRAATLLADDQYVQHFLSVAIPNYQASEVTYWTKILRAAEAQGLDVLLLATREMGRTIFESAAYANRGRTNHEYVYDLYQTYMMRDPDSGGWTFWEGSIPALPGGRAITRASFLGASSEFPNLVATLTAGTAVSGPASSIASALVDPFNQTGDQLEALDSEWSLPLISLPGRAGLDLGLGLSYSSMVWTRSQSYLYFDEDSSPISPGFRLGFASIQGPYFDAQVGKKIYILISSSGRRVQLRQTDVPNVYEATDSSYLQLTDNSGEVTWTNASGVTTTGNNLTATTGGWGNAGAVSTQTIPAGDGYVEFTASETNTYRVLGLSHGDSSQNYDDIDYGLELTNDGRIYIYEGGVGKGFFGTYATGDTLRVAVEGGQVKYRRNGAWLYTSNTAPTYPLLVDTSLHNSGSTLTNVTMSSLWLRSTDGTQISYSPYANGWQANRVMDRNGNYLSIVNDDRGIQKITDTLGRVIEFTYDNYDNLLSITQNWNGTTHPWATFGWEDNLSMNVSGFTGVKAVGTYTGEQIPVLRQVGLDDGSYYLFEYTGAAQVNMIRRKTWDNVERSRTAFDYDNANNDCPRLTQTRVWADNWTGLNGVPSEVTTQFTPLGDGSHQLTVIGDPNGTVYKEFYGTGWQKGLVTRSEVWSGATLEKWTNLSYEHDGASGADYATNPRVKQTDIGDAGNLRRTKISYANFGLPSDVYEFDGSTVLRRTHTDYAPAGLANYLAQRIIGLPSATYLCDGAQGETPCGDSSGSSLQAKTEYRYDESAPTYQGEPVRHEASYGTGFLVRGNLTSTRRYNIANPTQYTSSSLQYNTAGSVIAAADAMGHTSTLSYTDAFLDSINHNTLAYPTMVTDADQYSSYVQYNYDFGAKTRIEGPPVNQTAGLIQTFTYDSLGRIYKVKTDNNGAATFYDYGPNYTQSWTSVNSVADSYSFQTFDGLGRVVGAGSSHPGSVGGLRAQMTQYDLMGRVKRVSNPTEINGSWVPSGDDGAGEGGGGGPQPVSWTYLVGVIADGNNLASVRSGWNTAGAVSAQVIASGNGYVEFTATETNTYRLLGLSHGDTSQNYDDIDYALELTNDGRIYIYEAGAGRGYFGTYTTGDALRVSVEGGVVKYRRNGALLYTSATAPTYPLLVDTSFYNYGSTLNNVMISGAGSGGWYYTEQTYDWKGRPLYTTSTDGTQKYASYTGCGCAGGEVRSLIDELGREQRSYSDALGRQWKTEVLNWNESVYSTTTNTFNARDQVTNVQQTDHATGAYQDTTMTYDGYGRLSSKHVPEQDAGKATVYTYKADDALESVTDARGASATYSYNNNRHLVTTISYDPGSSGAPDTPNVSFEYDAAGNRTSMTDGMGDVSYGYDSLSRMTSETRYFSDLTHSYVINYGYNLANQLASVSTPEWGRTVGYGYDSSGGLNAVTGSGYVTGSYSGTCPSCSWSTQYVTTFTSGISRRAWGAVKQMTLGNGVQQSLSYNSRMQATQNQVTNFNQSVTTGATYEYYADGRIQNAWRPDSSGFDRSYSYDQAGRIASALTGNEAHGGSTADGPYREIFSYDVWGNTTSLTKRIWSSTTTVNTPFSNNRGQQNLGYDANGFVVWNHDGTLGYSHEYDAAGKRTHFVPQVGEIYGQHSVEMSDTFDGNGLPNKRVDTRRYINPDTLQPYTVAKTGYYLHSTMLGGQVIAELDAQGNRTVSYIYVEGMQLAKEQVGGWPSGALVFWQFNDPITGTNGTTNIQRDYMGATELDPLGADITSPPPPPDPSNYEAPVYSEPTKQTYYQIEGGPSADYVVDGWYMNMVNKDFDAWNAQRFHNHGFRDWAADILANNPNVGVLSRELDKDGNVTGIGLHWGKNARGFLLGVDKQIQSGELVQAGGYAEVSGYQIGDQYTEDSGEPPPAAKLYGPFVINLPSPEGDEEALRRWKGQHGNGVGGGWCAQLAQYMAEVFGNSQGMPLGLAGGGRWRAGRQASGDMSVVRGTVLISGVKEWGKSGVFYYPNYQDMGNHTAIVLAHLPNGGLKVLEQIHGTIQIVDKQASENGDYFRNARGYYVLMVGPRLQGVPMAPYYPKH